LIISRYTDRNEAELLSQHVLSTVADAPIQLSGRGEAIYRTCSLGWAAFPWSTENPFPIGYEEVLTLADRGLHRAKALGKNRAVGVIPASGQRPATTIEGLHSGGLQVDLLSVAGPALGNS
jgi:GGDEF domain-containing protein